MKISIISGSVREGRMTHRVALAIEKSLKSLAIDTFMFDVLVENLPPQGKESNIVRVGEISEELKSSDAVIVISPEYNGSYTGALKNAIDYFHKAEYGQKPIGLVGVSAGVLGGINVIKQLQVLFNHIGGYVLPENLLNPNVSNVYTETGEVTDEKQKERIQFFLDALIAFTNRLK